MALIATGMFPSKIAGKGTCLEYAAYAETLHEEGGEVDIHLYYSDT